MKIKMIVFINFNILFSTVLKLLVTANKTRLLFCNECSLLPLKHHNGNNENPNPHKQASIPRIKHISGCSNVSLTSFVKYAEGSGYIPIPTFSFSTIKCSLLNVEPSFAWIISENKIIFAFLWTYLIYLIMTWFWILHSDQNEVMK